MKKRISSIVFAIIMIAGVAYAAPKYVEVVSPVLSGNIVTLGTLPSGYVLMDVVIYDDVRGISGRSIGAQSPFELRQGEGFNFVVRHPDGGEYWQMVTPKSVAGTGLWISCVNGGCKYYRPMDGEQPASQR